MGVKIPSMRASLRLSAAAIVLLSILSVGPVEVGAVGSRSFVAVSPARLLETRPGSSTVDGVSAGGGLVSGGGVVRVPVAGRGGVPSSGVGAVVVNVTVVDAQGSGYVSVYASGGPRPLASNLNFVAGQVVPNLVITSLGADGRIELFASAGVQLLVDVMGWFPVGGSFNGLSPARLLETRPGSSTVDGVSAGGGLVSGGGVVRVPVAGRGGVPSSGVGAVVVNVTVVDAQGSGYVSVYASGGPRPLASNLNFVAGQVVPNLVITSLGADGRIELFASAGVQLLVDVMGWLPPDSLSPPPPPPPVEANIAVVYAVTSGRTPDATMAPAIRQELDLVTQWFQGQAGGRRPLFARDGASITVTTVALTVTKAQLESSGSPMSTLSGQLAVAGIAASRTKLVYVDANFSACSDTSGVMAVLWMAACNVYPKAATPAWPYGASYLAAHELARAFGAVPACAPHRDASGLVNDDPRDLLYQGPLARQWNNLILDVNHDDYFGHGRAGCTDIANNAMLAV